MVSKGEKVVVAMSGGVDSSVAACLLVEQGFDVVGLFMRIGVDAPEGEASAAATRPHRGCCSASDAGDARFVAGMLDVPFFSLNFKEDFDRIIDYFADEYVRGRTPNPCVVCNDRLKFGKLLGYADMVGAKCIATGHYARISGRDGHPLLMQSVDRSKDQTYVLFGLKREIMDRILFPVGGMQKEDVRALAARYGLPNQDKPDSVDICFVPDRDYARVVRERRPEAFAEGDILDGDGRVVGRHKGIGQYTIGQRRGLGVAAAGPRYVTQLDVLNNTVTLQPREALHKPALIAGGVNYLCSPPTAPFDAKVKIRYQHPAAAAQVYPLADGQVRVVFADPQSAITPGQAVVFYDGDVVIGGGWIERALDQVDDIVDVAVSTG